MATPRVNRIESMCWNGTLWRPEQERTANARGEGRTSRPLTEARNDDQAKRGDAKARAIDASDHLAARARLR